MTSERRYAIVSRDIAMPEEMFDALMGFEVKHLRAPGATFSRDEIICFLQETSTPKIVDAFKGYYLMRAPDATNLS